MKAIGQAERIDIVLKAIKDEILIPLDIGMDRCPASADKLRKAGLPIKETQELGGLIVDWPDGDKSRFFVVCLISGTDDEHYWVLWERTEKTKTRAYIGDVHVIAYRGYATSAQLKEKVA